MHILYADDTYAKASKEDPPGRVHLFGGIVVHRDSEPALIAEIRKIKTRFTHPNMPIKWNFKDTTIRKKFEEFNRQAEYENMLAASREWRLDLFRQINGLNYKVIVSCIEAFSEDQKIIGDVKNQLNTYCFENVLMRVGLDAREIGGNWQCVLDWPPDNDPKPFDRGYYQLFHAGKASSPKPAICGPLEALRFSHSLHYTRANHSPLMQLADLVLGAVRDDIECKIQGRGSSVGSECVDIFYEHFRHNKGVVPRYGVTASTGSRTLADHIEEIFKRTVTSP